MCLKGRDFEVPTSGGLYLTQDNPELSLVFDVGKEILTYKDEEECARIIREILADPQRADEIREAGRARSLRDHTYLARWTSPLTIAGLLAG
jgi:spore maturation protein CgeB